MSIKIICNDFHILNSTYRLALGQRRTHHHGSPPKLALQGGSMNEETRTTTAVDEPVRTTETQRRASGGTLAKRIVYYIGGVIIALIALRFIFLLLGANRGSGFVDFIYDVSSVFVAPFVGIFGQPTFGVSYVETASIVAIIIYGLVTIGIGKLFTLNRSV